MTLIKKLIFAPVFLIALGFLIYRLAPLLDSYDFFFSLSTATFIQLMTISLLICASSLLFILVATIALDWKIVLPIALISSIIPLILIPPALAKSDLALAIIFAVTVFASLLLTYVSLGNTLKDYLNFQPSCLLGPAIRNLSGLLIVCFCVVYFLSSSKVIAQNGFQIPDSLIDAAIKLASSAPTISRDSSNTPQLSIPPEQLKLLKNNPDLLKQYGLDPKMLDNLTNPQAAIQAPVEITNDIKQAVKDQIQNFIKPFISFIPAILTVLLFFTLQFLTSILNTLIYPLLWLIFLILEKTGFIRFEVEQRPVKKMVV